MDSALFREPALGRFARSFARTMVRVYYPQVEVEGAETLPRDRPLLICANHPNSLLDPVVVGYVTGLPVRFFAKAPLFDTHFLGAVMRALGMIPAYRGSDDRDREMIRKNLESLDKGIDALVAGHPVGIFPEGKTHDLTRVEMVRGGAARMALEAVKRGASKLAVVPISINYEQKERFRTSVWVRFAPPILMDEWIAVRSQHGVNERALTREFTSELERRLVQATIHLDDPNWQRWLDALETLTADFPPQRPTSVPQLVRRKQIADAINAAVVRNREEAVGISREIQCHCDAARDCGLGLRADVLRYPPGHALRKNALRLFTFGILAPPALLGIALHIVPFHIVRFAARRITPPGRTAMSFYKLLVGIPVYLLWYLLLTWLISPYVNWPTLAAITASLPLLGLLGLRGLQLGRCMIGETWHTFRAILRPQELQTLRQQRAALGQRLMALAETVPPETVNKLKTADR